ncbi:MAG: hypothetical protein ACREL7_06010 [Longimicrobiales bacterium]
MGAATVGRIARLRLRDAVFALMAATPNADALAGDYRVTQEEMRRRGFAPPEHFSQFVERRNPGLLDFEHVPRMVDVGHRIAHGELQYVIVCMPPRYFKSELFSRLLPAYFERQYPNRWSAVISHGADLAWSLSEDARGNFVEDGGRIRRETGAKKRWRTNRGGGLWAFGVGAKIIGHGYHLGVLDDPSDPERVVSPTYLKKFAEWWPSKFLSRRESGARIVVVMQRLGTDDPIDWLLRREIGEDTELAPMNWHVVICDEIKSNEPLGRWDGPMGLPPTCTIEPDDRKPGQVLAPSRFSDAEVRSMQAQSGSYTTDAQRQQRPQSPKGDYWREEWFGEYDELPYEAHNGGNDWDTAYTEDEANSASARIHSFRGKGKADEFPIFIHDVDWDWWEFPELLSAIREIKGPHYLEAKATGKSAAQAVRRNGIVVSEIPVHGDKFARANSVQEVVSSGRVYVRRAIRRRLLKGDRQGLLRVRAETLVAGGPDLDLNDAFVQALIRHTRKAITTSLPPGSLSGGSATRRNWAAVK